MSHEVPTIDVTIAGESANSYITLAEGDTYHGGHVNHTDWSGATDDQKKEAVVMATRLLDQWVDWAGYRATREQALRWPRFSTYDRDGYVFDSDIIPQWLKDATAELSRHLLIGDTTGVPDTSGFSELQVGSLKLKVDSVDRDKYGALPDSVLVIIEPYGQIRKRGNAGTVNLMRA
jgi:hypothetical protein